MKPHRLFRTPRVKFFMDVTSFFVFLSLFSAILFDGPKITDSITNLEWTVMVWGVGYLLHEVNQVVADGFKKYWEDGWNRFDVVICAFIIVRNARCPALHCNDVSWFLIAGLGDITGSELEFRHAG